MLRASRSVASARFRETDRSAVRRVLTPLADVPPDLHDDLGSPEGCCDRDQSQETAPRSAPTAFAVILTAVSAAVLRPTAAHEQPPITTGVAATSTENDPRGVGAGHSASGLNDRLRDMGTLAYLVIDSTSTGGATLPACLGIPGSPSGASAPCATGTSSGWGRFERAAVLGGRRQFRPEDRL